MIRAMIFDLDGTLVQTEKLKALSYAKATVELCPHTVTEDEAIAAFKNAVGLSRREAALKMMEQFDLMALAQQRMAAYKVSEPWQAFVQIRLRYYDALMANPATLKQNQWPHNMALLEAARQHGCTLALATMSGCAQVNHVLMILGLENTFDFIATRDDVEHGKPNPEIYTLVGQQLGVPADECLVIEDSPSGVMAARAAGMHVIAVSTPFTRDGLRQGDLQDAGWIVDNPDDLLPTVRQFVELS